MTRQQRQRHVPVVAVATLAVVVLAAVGSLPTLVTAVASHAATATTTSTSSTTTVVPYAFARGDPLVSSICQQMRALHRRGVGSGRGSGDGMGTADGSGSGMDEGNSSLCQQQQQQDEQQQHPLLSSSSLASRLHRFVVSVRFFCAPRIWRGFMDVQSKASSSLFHTSILLQSVGGFLFPLVVLLLLDQIQMTRIHIMMTTQRQMNRVTWCVCLFSPWSLGCLYQFVSQCGILLRSLRMQLTIQSITLSRATTLLQQRIHAHRAYRTARYDVYLPSSLFSTTTSTNNSKSDNNHNRIRQQQQQQQQQRQQQQQQPQQQQQYQAALLLIPGATVSHEAYSEVAGRLSDAGLVVAVLSLEPLRLAHHHLGTEATAITRLIHDITTTIRTTTTTSPTTTSRIPPRHPQQHQQQQQRRQSVTMKRRTSRNWMRRSRSTTTSDNDNNETDDRMAVSSSLLPQQQQQQPQQQPQPQHIVEWSFMGHSMGAFAAMQLFSELVVMKDTENENAYTNENDTVTAKNTTTNAASSYRLSQTLIMVGVSALFLPFLTDLSQHHTAQILLVQGTQDPFVVQPQQQWSSTSPGTGNGNGVYSSSSSSSLQSGKGTQQQQQQQQQELFESYFPNPSSSSSSSRSKVSSTECGNECGDGDGRGRGRGGTTRTEWILGGTHDGFSSYRLATTTLSKKKKNDQDHQNQEEEQEEKKQQDTDTDTDTAHLLLSEQHQQTCAVIVRFLRTSTSTGST